MRCLLVLVLGVAVLAVLLWVAFRPTEAPPAPLKAVPVAGLTGYVDQPALSPDGPRVALIGNFEQTANLDVYVKSLGRGRAARLTTHPAVEYSPAWSPDGRQIAFLRAMPGPGGPSDVVVMPAAGGTERKLGQVGLQPDSPLLPAPFLCWTPDASALVVTHRERPEEPPSLYRLSLETGAKRRITSPPLGAPGDSGPSFAPDGGRLAFTRCVGFAVADIYVVPLAAGFVPAGDAARLTYENRFHAGTAWTPDGREIVYGGFSGCRYGLFRLKSSAPEVPVSLGTAGQDGAYPSVSVGARRLVYLRVRAGGDAFEAFADVSPDGQRRAFASARSGNLEIWSCASAGGDCAPLTALGAPFTGFPRWSPDGEYLAFFSNLEGQNEIYVIPASGGRPRRLAEDPGDDVLPAWSRDGRWIYFVSNRAGSYEVWKVRAFGIETRATPATRAEGVAGEGRFAWPAPPKARQAELMRIESFR